MTMQLDLDSLIKESEKPSSLCTALDPIAPHHEPYTWHLGSLGVELRTLVNADRGISKEFDPDYFCETAGEGEYTQPFNSCHFLSIYSRIIGSIFKLYPDEPWSVAIASNPTPQVAGHDFDRALNYLVELWEKDWQYWKDFYRIKR